MVSQAEESIQVGLRKVKTVSCRQDIYERGRHFLSYCYYCHCSAQLTCRGRLAIQHSTKFFILGNGLRLCALIQSKSSMWSCMTEKMHAVLMLAIGMVLFSFFRSSGERGAYYCLPPSGGSPGTNTLGPKWQWYHSPSPSREDGLSVNESSPGHPQLCQ